MPERWDSMIPDKQKLKLYRKDLLLRKTRAEIVFENALRARVKGKGSRLKVQYILGFYIADFYYRSKALIIELDGGIHDTIVQIGKDARRDAFFLSKGFTVLRFKNEEVFNELEKCIQTVIDVPMISRKKRSGPASRAHWHRKKAVRATTGRKDWQKA